MAYVPATGPETTKQLLDRSLHLYKTAFHKIFPIALALAILAFTPRMLALVYGAKLHHFSLSINQLAQLLLDLLSMIFFTAMLWDMRCVMTNDQENLIKDFKKSLKKIPLIIGASVVETAILLISTLTLFTMYFIFIRLFTHHFVIPADRFKVFLLTLPMIFQVLFNVFIFILLLFYLPIIVAENKGIFIALLRSAKLVWGNVWRVLKLQLTPWFIYSLWLIFFKNVFGLKIHIYFFALNNLSWSAVIVHLLIFALFVPWSAATLLVQLHDLELRKKLKPFDQK
ncbi:MAG: hypothetical protein V4501_11065 [Pseudomonadota bacterium]